MLICLQYSTKQSLSHLVSLSKLSVANLQMSAQVPFLICQQYVLRCPLLMGEDSNKMGFCEAKMSFSHTNEAGLTGLEVSSRDSKPKDAMDVPCCTKNHIFPHRLWRRFLHPPPSSSITHLLLEAGQSKRDGYCSRTKNTSRILVLHPHHMK